MVSSGLSTYSKDLLHRDANLYVDENIVLTVASAKFFSILYEIINFNREHFSQLMAWPSFVNHEKIHPIFLIHVYARIKTMKVKHTLFV